MYKNNIIPNLVEKSKKKYYRKLSEFLKKVKLPNFKEFMEDLGMIITGYFYDIEGIYLNYYKDSLNLNENINKYQFTNLKINVAGRLSYKYTVRRDKILLPLPNKKFLNSDDFKNSIKNYFKNIYNNHKYCQISKFGFTIHSDKNNQILCKNNQYLNYNNNLNNNYTPIENLEISPNPQSYYFINGKLK